MLDLTTVEALAEDPFVTARSDWGIDTVITHATSALDVDVYEHNLADGKRHALYGSLTEIEDMLLECLDAVASLRDRSAPIARFEADPPAEVPGDLKETVGYDLEATRRSILRPPNSGEGRVLDGLGINSDGPLEIDDLRWHDLLPRLLDEFVLGDPSWRSAVFRLWVERVIEYTTTHVSQGYDHAIAHLEATIERFESG